MEEQVVALYAGVNGYLDDIPTPQVARFHDELREHMRADESVLKAIRETGDISEETEQQLREEIEKFKNAFNVETEESLVG
jgi:F-type H+-transporting ATPase subunit alpha